MIQNPYYFLQAIGENTYLMPFGQAIEDYAPSIKLTDVAAFLWTELKTCADTKSLAKRITEKYEISPEEEGQLEDDVEALLHTFRKNNIVLERKTTSWNARPQTSVYDSSSFEFPEEKAIHIMRIAGITIRFCGKEDHFSENFIPFCIDTNCSALEKNINPDICSIVSEDIPRKCGNLSPVLRGSGITVFDGGEFFIMRTLELPALREVRICKDGSKAIFYINTEAGMQFRRNLARDCNMPKELLQTSLAESIFCALRQVFLIKAQRLGMYAIHSASILHEGKAWLFSAPSGTGKSTHTKIWNRIYGTPYLNGDLNLIALENNRPVVKGIPWCGTSGIFTTKTYPLGGIILLTQDKDNYMEELSYDAQVLGIQMRFISPKWTEKQAVDSVAFAEKIVKVARVARLHCNMENEAAETCRVWIDD